MKRLVFTLCVFIAFSTFANAGVLYNCIDRDGHSIFTDTPQDGMKCDLKSDDSKMETLPKEQIQQKYEQIGKTKRKLMKMPKIFKRMPDYACLKEYEKNMDKKCVDDVVTEVRSSLSPHCREFVEPPKKEEELYKDCLQEIVMAANRVMHEIEKCNELPADSKCREQIQSAVRLRLWQATKEALKK